MQSVLFHCRGKAKAVEPTFIPSKIFESCFCVYLLQIQIEDFRVFLSLSLLLKDVTRERQKQKGKRQ